MLTHVKTGSEYQDVAGARTAPLTQPLSYLPPFTPAELLPASSLHRKGVTDPLLNSSVPCISLHFLPPFFSWSHPGVYGG